MGQKKILREIQKYVGLPTRAEKNQWMAVIHLMV